jgi:hypothetical protein
MQVSKVYKLTVFVFVVASIFILFGGIYFTATFDYSSLPQNIAKTVESVIQFKGLKTFVMALFFLMLANIFMLYYVVYLLENKVIKKED